MYKALGHYMPNDDNLRFLSLIYLCYMHIYL